MPEILESGNFNGTAILSVVNIIDQLVCRIEPDKFDPVFVTDALNVGNERLAVFRRPCLVSWSIYEPGDINGVVATEGDRCKDVRLVSASARCAQAVLKLVA